MTQPDPAPEWYSMENFEQFQDDAAGTPYDEAATRRYEVDENGEGERLDAWLAHATGTPRAHIQRLLDEERVHYLGPRCMARLKSSARLQAGDLFRLDPLPTEPLDLEPEDVPLDIVHEDADLLVVVKPRGMVVHPATGVTRGTLVNALLAHCHDLSGIGGVARPGIVHRLDKDTSGLMVVAKNDATHTALSRQFAGRVVKKEYLALVHGRPSSSSVIDMPIGRHPMDRKRMAVVYTGRPAVTEYERIEEFAEFSLIRVRLRTGRTHQIRVHMVWLGHPVAGDPVYCRRDPLGLGGQFLHAACLGFTHPVTARPLEFRAPLPADLQHALDTLRVEARKRCGEAPRMRKRLDSLQVLDGWREAASGA